MTAARQIEGTCEVFEGDNSLGRAAYLLIDVSTKRNRSARGTITFDNGTPRVTPVTPLTIKMDNGVTFQIVITSDVDGRVSIASKGPVPGM